MDVAASFGIDPGSVLQVSAQMREYREWEVLVIAEEQLPLAERRVEFTPLLRRMRNVLRREGIEMGADLLGPPPGAVPSFRSAGKAVNADVQRTLTSKAVDHAMVGGGVCSRADSHIWHEAE